MVLACAVLPAFHSVWPNPALEQFTPNTRNPVLGPRVLLGGPGDATVDPAWHRQCEPSTMGIKPSSWETSFWNKRGLSYLHLAAAPAQELRVLLHQHQNPVSASYAGYVKAFSERVRKFDSLLSKRRQTHPSKQRVFQALSSLSMLTLCCDFGWILAWCVLQQRMLCLWAAACPTKLCLGFQDPQCACSH